MQLVGIHQKFVLFGLILANNEPLSFCLCQISRESKHTDISKDLLLHIKCAKTFESLGTICLGKFLMYLLEMLTFKREIYGS